MYLIWLTAYLHIWDSIHWRQSFSGFKCILKMDCIDWQRDFTWLSPSTILRHTWCFQTLSGPFGPFVNINRCSNILPGWRDSKMSVRPWTDIFRSPPKIFDWLQVMADNHSHPWDVPMLSWLSRVIVWLEMKLELRLSAQDRVFPRPWLASQSQQLKSTPTAFSSVSPVLGHLELRQKSFNHGFIRADIQIYLSLRVF